MQAVSQRGGCRLVNDPQNIKARNLARIFSGLALRIVKVSGNRDHSLSNRLAEISLSRFLHLCQRHGADFRRGEFFVAALDVSVAILAFDNLIGDELGVFLDGRVCKRATDQALDRIIGIFGVCDGLTTGRLPDQALAVFGKGDNRGRGARAFAIFDDTGCVTIHDGDA